MEDPMPLVEVSAASPSVGLNLAELWQFRELILTLAERDIKLRYKQTALGPWWVLFQPLLSAGVFSFVFGRVAGLSSGLVPYFVLTYTGMMGWNLFSNALTRSSGSVVANAQLVSKVYFPRLVMPLAVVLTTLLDVAISAVPLVGCWIVYR
ncbi:MAG TPA: ABC transporter permease, partial [Candidatus Xenobia bacterium]